MSGTRDLVAVVLADWRRLLMILVGGWSIYALVLFMGLNYLGCRGCPPGTVPAYLSQKVLLFSTVYALGPWVFSVHSVRHGTDVLAALPLSPARINLFMILRGVTIGVLCIPACILAVRLLPRYGMEVFPWIAVSAALSVLAYQLVGMATGTFVRVAIYAVFPLVVFPPYPRAVVAGPLAFAASPWSGLILAAVVAFLLPAVLERPPIPAKGGD